MLSKNELRCEYFHSHFSKGTTHTFSFTENSESYCVYCLWYISQENTTITIANDRIIPDFNKINWDNITVDEIMKQPEKYHDHYERINNADLHYPILVFNDKQNDNMYIIVDGCHRFVKNGLLLGNKEIRAKIITIEQLELCKNDVSCN